jgi:hypothetical protein
MCACKAPFRLICKTGHISVSYLARSNIHLYTFFPQREGCDGRFHPGRIRTSLNEH